MSKLRVDEVQNRPAATATPEAAEVKRRAELHARSTFQRRGPETFSGIGKADLSALKGGDEAPVRPRPRAQTLRHTFASGQTVEVPGMAAERRAAVEALLEAMPPAMRAQVEASLAGLGEAASAMVLAGDGAAVGAAASALASSADASYEMWLVGPGEQGAEARSGAVMDAAVWGVEQYLHEFMGKAVSREGAASEVRAGISELEGMLTDWPDDGSTQLFSYREVVINQDGTVSYIDHQNVALTKEQAEELLGKLKGQLDSLSVFINRDQMQLQMLVHKYQQVTTTASNIMKNVDETRKGIISNLKA